MRLCILRHERWTSFGGRRATSCKPRSSEERRATIDSDRRATIDKNAIEYKRKRQTKARRETKTDGGDVGGFHFGNIICGTLWEQGLRDTLGA